MRIGLGDNALSPTSKMAFSSQNHNNCELLTGSEITEHIHNVKPLTRQVGPAEDRKSN